MSQTREGALKVAAVKMGITVEEYIAHKAMDERRCSVCKTWKPRAMFPRNSGPKNAASGTCLECTRAQYVQHPREYGPSPMRGKHFPKAACEHMAEAHRGVKNHNWKGGASLSKPRDPAATKAKREVNHAIAAGRLVAPGKLPCFECGKPATEYHHHRGYAPAHWFDVRALCRGCHMRHHPKGSRLY